jgi:hypothetical protein
MFECFSICNLEQFSFAFTYLTLPYPNTLTITFTGEYCLLYIDFRGVTVYRELTGTATINWGLGTNGLPAAAVLTAEMASTSGSSISCGYYNKKAAPKNGTAV